MNITEPIWRHSHAWPDRIAVVYDGKPISYAQLRSLVALAGMRLARAGVMPGDCVALDVRSPAAHLLTVLAAARMGAFCAAFHAAEMASVKEQLLARHGSRWLVQDKQNTWHPANLGPAACIDVDGLFSPLAGGEELKPPRPFGEVDDKPWIIALSSGTTGLPKSIPLLHARSLLGCALRSAPDFAEPLPTLLFVGLSVYMGIGNAVRTLLTGGTLVLTASGEPRAFFEIVQRDQPARVTTSSGTALALVTYAARHLPQSLAACASVRTITLAGAAVSPALQSAIAQRICAHIEINYGSTESGRIAHASSATLAVHPHSAGRLEFWVDGEAVDEQDRRLAHGVAGILRFKTLTLMQGYVGDQEATARALRGTWYYPGDTGSIDKDGYVTLTGRVDELLNLGGRKVDPVVVEQALNAHPAVMESGVVAKMDDRQGCLLLVAVVVLKDQTQLAPAELQQWCRDRVGSGKTPDRVVFVKALPKNTGGKLMRTELGAAVKIRSADHAPASVGMDGAS